MEEVAQRKGLSLTGEALYLLDEWIEDVEEIESEIEKFCLAEQKSVTADMVRELSKDEGSRALIRLLDGVCLRDGKTILSSLKQLQGKTEFLVVVTSLYNRLRLASLFFPLEGEGRMPQVPDIIRARWPRRRHADTPKKRSGMQPFRWDCFRPPKRWAGERVGWAWSWSFAT
ncbi:MAG: hypothetical protein ABC360_01985 [Acetomicrobium sp.]